MIADVWDENANTSMQVTVYWYNESGFIAEGKSTTKDLKDQQTGWKNISAETFAMCNRYSGVECYDRGHDSTIIKITGLSNVQWIEPPDQLPPYDLTIYEDYNFTCRVYDGITLESIPDYYVEKWYRYGTDSYQLMSGEFTNPQGRVTDLYTPDKKGALFFKCNITDNETMLYTASTAEVEVEFNVKDNLPPEILNISVYPTSEIEANLDNVSISAIVTDNVGVNTVWASIAMPNGSYYTKTMTVHSPIIFNNLVENASNGNYGFNETVDVSQEYGEMEYFNATINNTNASKWIYFNISINDQLVFSNVSVANASATEIELVNNYTFTVPGVYNVTVDMTDGNGNGANETYLGYLKYRVNSFWYNTTYVAPIGGLYNVTIYAQDLPPENNLNSEDAGSFYVWGKTVATLEMTPDYEVAIGVTQYDSYLMNLTVNYTNKGPANAWDVNITLTEDSGGWMKLNATNHSCAVVPVNSSCAFIVEVEIISKTPPGIININGNATWMHPDKTLNYTTDISRVEVAETPLILIEEDELQGQA
ncbi:MAG: hypothetical protein DRO87_13285, partial [Candidatus Thorarchaeota archaeon]